MKASSWTEEYYLEYYDETGRRYYTPYFINLKDAKQKEKELESQEFKDVTLHVFRY